MNYSNAPAHARRALIKLYFIVDTQNFIFNFAVVYKNMSEAVKKHPEADILINFASLRSAFDATMEAMSFNQVRTYVKDVDGEEEREREYVRASWCVWVSMMKLNLESDSVHKYVIKWQ